MTKRALIIGPAESERIARMVAKATANPTPFSVVQERSKDREEGQKFFVDENMEYTMHLPIGHIVTFTHEEQRQCICRHLSVSLVDFDGKGQVQPSTMLPDPAAVNMILAAFGFHNSVEKAAIWIDKREDQSVLNVLEPLDGNMDQIKHKPEEKT